MTSVIQKRPTTTGPGADEPTEAIGSRRQAVPLVFEKSVPGQRAVDLPPLDVPRAEIPAVLLGSPVELPGV